MHRYLQFCWPVAETSMHTIIIIVIQKLYNFHPFFLLYYTMYFNNNILNHWF